MNCVSRGFLEGASISVVPARTAEEEQTRGEKGASGKEVMDTVSIKCTCNAAVVGGWTAAAWDGRQELVAGCPAPQAPILLDLVTLQELKHSTVIL